MNIRHNEDAAVQHETVAMCGTLVAVETLDMGADPLAAHVAPGREGFSRQELCAL